jgi:hypothetical protein
VQDGKERSVGIIVFEQSGWDLGEALRCGGLVRKSRCLISDRTKERARKEKIEAPRFQRGWKKSSFTNPTKWLGMECGKDRENSPQNRGEKGKRGRETRADGTDEKCRKRS